VRLTNFQPLAPPGPFQVVAGLGQTRLTDVVVGITLVVVGALGSLQETVVRTEEGVVLQETVVVDMTVTRYVVYAIHQLEYSLEGRI
jgi:hypothetical protein